MMNEAQLNEASVTLLKTILPQHAVLHHSPNEGMRHVSFINTLKKHGTKMGWPDLEIMHKGRAYFIELKAPYRKNHRHGGCSKAQLECHQELTAAGCQVAVCHTLEAVEGVVRAWMPVRGRVAA